MEKPVAYKNDNGIWIYNRLPEGMRVATKDDFFDENNEIILDKPFLAQSFHFPWYEAHITKSNFIEKWEPWLNENRLFLKTA